MASLNDIETRIQNIIDIIEVRVISTITGVLPITFRADGTALINYRIYGTADGAGVQTENLFNKSTALIDYRVASYGIQELDGYACSDFIEVTAGEKITVTQRPPIPNFYFYDTTQTFLSNDTGFTCTVPNNAKYVRCNLLKETIDTFMLVFGSTAPETYIPYGYKLPLMLTSGVESKDTDIYIGDSKLLSNDYLDYETGKIVRNGTPQDPPKTFPEIDTYIGINTLDSVETLGEVTIKGKIKEVI